MYKKLVNFIKNNMESNTEQFSMRIPKDLKKYLEKNTKGLKLPLPDYVRAIMTYAILPEILESELKKVACEWITKQGKSSIEVHFDTKMKKLREILDLTSYALNETERLQQKFIDAEVEYMNNINSQLH